MGSPITLSGFNKIDFNMVLNAIMTQERQPITALETRQSTLQSQTTLFSTLDTKMTSLLSAIDTMRKPDSLAVLSASSSDAAAVGVSTTTGTVAGTYNVIVSELAKAQVLSSTSSCSSLTQVVATGGSMTVTPVTGDPITVALTGPTTIAELANKINAVSDSPIAASVVQTSPGNYQLMLTSKDTGTTGGFSVTHTLTGGSGLTFADADLDGVYGDTAADNTQAALNAAFTVNGLAVTSATNTVDDVIPGATLTLKKKDPASVIAIEVSKDASGAKDRLKKFITAYNDITQFTKDQTTASVAGRASLARDPLLRGLREEFGKALRDQYAEGGTLDKLALVGVGYDVNGKLALDEERFDEAYNTKAVDLQNLFSGADGEGGIFGAFHAVVDNYTKTGGLIDSAKTRLTGQVDSIGKRLDQLEDQLEIRRSSLQKEMIAADMAMSRLSNQSSALSSLGGGYRLF